MRASQVKRWWYNYAIYKAESFVVKGDRGLGYERQISYFNLNFFRYILTKTYRAQRVQCLIHFIKCNTVWKATYKDTSRVVCTKLLNQFTVTSKGSAGNLRFTFRTVQVAIPISVPHETKTKSFKKYGTFVNSNNWIIDVYHGGDYVLSSLAASLYSQFLR